MKTILTIDDSVDTRSLHKLLLEFEGFRVLSAASAEEGLEIVSKHLEIDLILCDLQMPGIGGLGFLGKFHSEFPQMASKVPIIITSGEEIPLPQGASGQIRKMTDIQTFIERVHTFLQ